MNFIPEYKFCLTKQALELPNSNIFLPTKGESKASGWDVRSTVDLKLKPYEKVLIHLGFKAFCPEGYWFELKPRSSSFAKKHLNSLYGTIDETYENEVMFCCEYAPPMNFLFSEIKKQCYGNSDVSIHKLHFEEYMYKVNSGLFDLNIKAGDPIAQIIPVKRQEMNISLTTEEEFNELCKQRASERKGGFGSTDKS